MSGDPWQVLHGFWSEFNIPAYDQASVPDDAVMPYITYTAVVSPFENTVLLTGDIWYNSTSWSDVSKKASDIAKALEGYAIRPIREKEFLLLTAGTPFAQRIYDEDDRVKRVHINITGEYLTYY